MSGTVKIVVSLLIIGGAATYLFAQTLGERVDYFHTADEVIVNPSEFAGSRIRVGGYVDECSILQKKGTFEFRFAVRPDHPHKTNTELKFPAAKGKTIPVEYAG